MDKPLTIEDKLKEAHSFLDEFESIHNLNIVSIPADTENILNLTHPQLEKLSAIQCSEYAFHLAQYAYYIQRIYNKESANLKWLNDQMLSLVSNKLNDYDKYTKYEVKLRLISRENEVAKRLLGLISFTEQKIERMSFLGATISKMSDKLTDLQRAKHYQTRGPNG